ncbi:branched-chain amino acid transport system II carrier protein [Eubacterium callanderi]|uniref:branched-chain amino acid transport system II carrier protein n=1 Tax=Eubacterium callanderi TaxID=53442 RepID=UPI001D07DAE4|nr:branched-chain amino acid transport system II carrier protein [Eubacterium callanderi]MCB6659023.1 branched-chain amino acid transport system II carrier protein [Eubacterium callanderi]MCB6752218.1 branched-chain amino acid transport system II carrier protein [Eubacterium callanderi]MCB7103275.1 branched-chain amino acid transport system II carrier protein [Eubacterium callanderi]MCG4818957.1 branched-chain amino acid transport system II carrier protein [Eubacterium callanderi]MCQ5189284.1 
MSQRKDKWIVGLALFSMFFGAGNVIFPPYLGMTAASMWVPAFICYYIADIGLAMLAILAMLKCDSDIEGITCRIGRIPAVLLSTLVVLCVGPMLAIPRTAATTFEMGVSPIFPGVNPLVASIAFFVLIWVLCVKEASVVDIVGKFLTPALFIGLMIVIIKGIIDPLGPIAAEPKVSNIISSGIISGYQTMDVLAALIFGVIIVKTVKEKGYTEIKAKNAVIGGAGLVAGAGLLIVYFGLAHLGATASTMYGVDVSRSTLILEIIKNLLGNVGMVIFGIVVALACITTAVALVSSSGAYFSRLCKGRVSYKVIVTIVCVISPVIANIGLDEIIAISEPVLSIVYAPALTLIILTIVGDKIKNDNVFKAAALGAFLISVLETAANHGLGFQFVNYLPLHHFGFGWLLPTVICGVAGYFIKGDKKKVSPEVSVPEPDPAETVRKGKI